MQVCVIQRIVDTDHHIQRRRVVDWRRHHNLGRAAVEVRLQVGHGAELPGCLKDDLHAVLAPRNVRGVRV